jgi:hypothetical protein
MNVLASLYDFLGHVHEATPLRLSVLDGREILLGPRHLNTIWTHSRLDGILFRKEKSLDSVRLVEGAFADLEFVLGPAHLDTL